MRTKSIDREGLTWRAFVCSLLAAAVMFAIAGFSHAAVRIQPAPRGLVAQGARYEFLRLWLQRGGEPPLGCVWVAPKNTPLPEAVLDCDTPISGRELICSQDDDYRRSLERKHGIDCGGE